jgi:hypothetical protein
MSCSGTNQVLYIEQARFESLTFYFLDILRDRGNYSLPRGGDTRLEKTLLYISYICMSLCVYIGKVYWKT